MIRMRHHPSAWVKRVVAAMLVVAGAGTLLAAARSQQPLCESLPPMMPLRGTEVVSACELMEDHPAVLVVNTASKCGFTPQFDGLEALYKQYREAGLQVLGFPSDNFGGQEYADAEETAKVCYLNYGVTFPMMQTGDVVGESAQPLFQAMAKATGEVPRWNFHKYLITADGVKSYSSKVTPEDAGLRADIERAVHGR